jgi:predicted TIM-barrel fold metal-dependent hydrolase
MATVVDIHPHVIALDNARYPLNPLGGKQSTWSTERPTSHEMLVRAMDEAGVDKAAIVQASTAYGYDNTYVAEAVAAHPQRFTGVFSVDVLAADAVEKITHWMERGLTGLRLFTTGSTMPGQATWFHDPRTYAAWGHVGEVGLPVCMQMTKEGFPPLRDLMARFPKVTIILDHLARPQLKDGPPYAADRDFFAFADSPNVYLKVTPLNYMPPDWGRATPETFFASLVEAFGADRIAWGSNFPATAGTLKDNLAAARKALGALKAADQDWIFGRTAQKLYPTLAD